MIGKKLIFENQTAAVVGAQSFFGVGDVMVPEITNRLQSTIGCISRSRMRGAKEARARGASVMLIYGAPHKKRCGIFADDLLANDQLTHLATNAGTIHDWGILGWAGRANVRSNVATGTFGTWEETGRNIHLALLAGGIEGRVMERRLGA